MKSRNLARTALITPVVFHLLLGLALAVFPLWPTDQRATFSGQTTIYLTSVAPREVAQHEPPPPIRITPRIASREMVISPRHASMASKRFVHVDAAEAAPVRPAEELSQAQTPADNRSQRQNVRTPSTAAPPPPVRVKSNRPAEPRNKDTAVPLPRQIGSSGQKTPPDFSRNPPPTYPAIARQRGWQGVVWVRVVIDREGRVSHVKVVKSSGHPVLDAAAVSALRRWRARPARRFGKPVPSVEVQSIRFRL